MFHRALNTAIILFWLLMTGLLVRVELFPDRGELLPIPVTHIVKLIFLHQQPSSLFLYNPQRQRLGEFHLQPQRVKNPDANGTEFLNLLGGSGATTVRFPGVPNGRMTFRFSMELSEKYEVQRFDWSATLHTPGDKGPDGKKTSTSVGFEFDGRPAHDDYHYLIRIGDKVEKEASGTMASLLADPHLSVMGFDPRAVLDQWEARQRNPPGSAAPAPNPVEVTARRGMLHFNGDDIETFLLTLRYQDSYETTIHLSQLGQVLSVKTFAGYNLYDDALVP